MDLNKMARSVFTQAVLNYKIIQVILFGKLKQVFTCLFPQPQVDTVRVEPEFYYSLFFLYLFYIP